MFGGGSDFSGIINSPAIPRVGEIIFITDKTTLWPGIVVVENVHYFLEGGILKPELECNDSVIDLSRYANIPWMSSWSGVEKWFRDIERVLGEVGFREEEE